jgi:GDP-D-mannose 3',5'-epimerase
MNNILILGSSGFIGSNLVDKFKKEGKNVVGIDIEYPKYCQPTEFYKRDLRYSGEDIFDSNDFSEIYCLACLMGGMGYIGDEEKHGYDIGIGSTQIVTNTIEWTRRHQLNAKIFYSSSACVYNQELQKKSDVVALKEEDAIPASPDLLYGWQKLYAEFMFMASGLDYRIARFHNVFGQWGSYDNGKEKAPAALCRKVALSKFWGEIEVWGSGKQTRSFLFIDEALEGVEKLMNSDFKKPINIGSDELISINDLAQMVIDISGKNLIIKNIDGIVGVMGRNSENSLIEKEIGWRPKQSLKIGMGRLYEWIEKQIYGNL